MAFGFERLLHDLRYRRDRFRQFIGVSFVALVSAAGHPTVILFWIGVPLIILGIAMRLWASGHIKKNKVLATDGPYAFVRHPLYVGNLTLGCGFSIASGLWWALPLFIGIVLCFYPHAIHQEDEKLYRMFARDWEEWRAKTRALIPHLSLKRSVRRGEWSFRQSLVQNGEPIIALFLLFWVYFLSLGLC